MLIIVFIHVLKNKTAIYSLNIGGVYLYALHIHKTLKLSRKENEKRALVS